MKVGVLGSGDVAKALAQGFIKHGHQVMLGTRNVAKLADWVALHLGHKPATSPTLRSLAKSWFSRLREQWRLMRYPWRVRLI